MPVSALTTVSTARNGVGTFILQCKRIDLHYCDWGGSSRGMKAFLTSRLLPNFTQAHPQIQVHISPRQGAHPVIRGHYINGREKAICVRNLEMEQILKKVELLRDTSGEKVKKVRGGRTVGSLNEGVRGVWDGFHPAPEGGRDLLGEKVERVGRGLIGGKKPRRRATV